MGRVVVITRHGGVASNYDCCNCPCSANFTGQLEVSPSSVNLVPGGTAQLNATAVYQSCTASLYFYSETAVSSWSSQSPSVATVSAGMVTAQNGGTANITAAWTDCASWYYNPRNHPPCCPASMRESIQAPPVPRRHLRHDQQRPLGAGTHECERLLRHECG